MNFKVGQKIVFIADPNKAGGHGNEILPVKDEIYTVRSSEEWGIQLNEIHNKPQNYYWKGRNVFCECAFDETAFRAVDDSFGEKVAEQIEKEIEKITEPQLA
jgi:hypothetical protein